MSCFGLNISLFLLTGYNQIAMRLLCGFYMMLNMNLGFVRPDDSDILGSKFSFILFVSSDHKLSKIKIVDQIYLQVNNSENRYVR